MSHIPAFRSTMPRSSLLACVVLVAAALVPAATRADVEWHPDLETAHAAARISRRPVLAVFVATWGEGTKSLESTCLRSPEAEAVLATCFEPVRIDIDEHATLTRAVGVLHVPTACVLAADDTALASFEMPDSPAAFVTAAILAAQRADAATHDGVAPGADQASTPALGTAPEPTAVTAAAFGSLADHAPGCQRPPRGSMARVAAKVRDLSAFATGQSRHAPAAAPLAIAQASRTVNAPRADDYTSISWPAEPATAPPTAPSPAPSIEPAGAPMAPAPWLDAPPARFAAPPQPTAPQTAPAQLPSTAPAEPQPAPRKPSLIATLQKPFGLPGTSAPEPATMPPALPRGPFSAAPPATVAAETAPQQEADVHGSMPLGLEGYCPVTLVDRGVWTEGRAQWGARHRGRTYLFAGAEEQRTFLTDPDRYAPALSGDDPVLALDRGSSTPGQRRYGVTFQSRVYLFATPETRTAFTNDPGRYTARIAAAERATSAARLY